MDILDRGFSGSSLAIVDMRKGGREFDEYSNRRRRPALNVVEWREDRRRASPRTQRVVWALRNWRSTAFWPSLRAASSDRWTRSDR